jgi:hypothetical protein
MTPSFLPSDGATIKPRAVQNAQTAVVVAACTTGVLCVAANFGVAGVNIESRYEQADGEIDRGFIVAGLVDVAVAGAELNSIRSISGQYRVTNELGYDLFRATVDEGRSLSAGRKLGQVAVNSVVATTASVGTSIVNREWRHSQNSRRGGSSVPC